MYKALPSKDIIDYTCSDTWVVIKYVAVQDLNNPLVTNKVYYTTDKKQIYIISTHPTKGAADSVLRKLKAKPNLPDDDGDRPYNLSLTERQAQVLVDALDLYSRIGMGQLTEISHVLRMNSKAVDEVDMMLREASYCWMGGAGSYYGITSDKINDVFRVAWDLQQVIRYRLAWDRNPDGGIQVHFDEPLKSSAEPLAVIKKV